LVHLLLHIVLAEAEECHVLTPGSLKGYDTSRLWTRVPNNTGQSVKKPSMLLWSKCVFPRRLSHSEASSNTKPILLEHRSSTWFIIISICVAVFTDLFLYGIIVPVLPFALHSRVGVAQRDGKPI
jgi:hypothetical protein